MKTASLARFFVLSLALAAPLASIACADENDPETWVKRLDDPAQRPRGDQTTRAILRRRALEHGNKRDDANVKKVLDVIVDPLTKTYTAGGLDDKTRKDLIKELGDMKDPRTAPALAKAMNEYEVGQDRRRREVRGRERRARWRKPA